MQSLICGLGGKPPPQESGVDGKEPAVFWQASESRRSFDK